MYHGRVLVVELLQALNTTFVWLPTTICTSASRNLAVLAVVYRATHSDMTRGALGIVLAMLWRGGGGFRGQELPSFGFGDRMVNMKWQDTDDNMA